MKSYMNKNILNTINNGFLRSQKYRRSQQIEKTHKPKKTILKNKG